MKEILIDTDYIKLDQFLKLVGFVQTGGQAKIIIDEGNIIVNDEVAFQRGKKIRKNDIVEIKGYESFVII
ncbi:RNA-binding S4 domain-containing protein [Tissierella sp.]|uniref:RNA-binding S4 domain-containing protein n=1 Tax=Tissierella sp. TaxID=41274 RepID=UPI0028A9543C|nr:RNA-binding S4 domain-containing protein [Tissierella sp.]